MSKKIQAPSELFQKVAKLAQANVAQLEQAAAEEQQLHKAAQEITDRLVRTGFVDAQNAQPMVEELRQGGIEKLAHTLHLLLDQTGEIVAEDMGKKTTLQKSASTTKPEKAEDKWFSRWAPAW